jgi:DNA polymerase-1
MPSLAIIQREATSLLIERMLELILHIRRLKLNRTKTFGAKPDYDGRMRTVYTIAGTETGRSNTKILKPPVRPEKIGMPFQTITKHGDVGTEAREFLIADDGYDIVETDMSQAEARIVALLARDDYMLDFSRRKADIHSITATWLFGIDLSDVTKELRFIGKTCRHAGNYDMGKKRLAELVNTDAKKYGINISISEYRGRHHPQQVSRVSLQTFVEYFTKRSKQPLQANNRVLVNPYGRYRQFYDRWGRELWKEAYAQIPQSTVPDHLRRAGIRTLERTNQEGLDVRFVVEAHDALVALVKKARCPRATLRSSTKKSSSQ